MAKIYTEKIKSHKNIYTENSNERFINIAYSIPDSDINENTGMLVLVPGYVGTINSNVYRHIREDFPDKFNVVVAQCDYFGSEFMQDDNPVDIKFAIEYFDKTKNPFVQIVDMGETIENFNDMGIMQALDVITSVIYVLSSLSREINTSKIILFGHSHGAYLGHLANILCPDMFSYMADISGYITPHFMLREDRLKCYAAGTVGNKEIVLKLIYNFLVRRCPQIRYDSDLYDLEYLYKHTENRCQIFAFHGVDDWMVNFRYKQKFLEGINNAEILLVNKEIVDNRIFKNTNHGLGLDYILFLEMFFAVINEDNGVVDNVLNLVDVSIEDKLSVSYKNIYPEINYINFKKKLN